MSPDVPFSCTDTGWTWPGVAQSLASLAPQLAPLPAPARRRPDHSLSNCRGLGWKVASSGRTSWKAAFWVTRVLRSLTGTPSSTAAARVGPSYAPRLASNAAA